MRYASCSTGRAGDLCLSVQLLYNRFMALDPANPPIWLRKLHVTAAQIDPSDYPATPEEGILRCCRLSDAMQAWSKACAQALGLSPLPPPPPFDNPFHLAPTFEWAAPTPHDHDAPR